MAFWWVNHNQTFQEETNGGYLWSPKKRKDGGNNQFYNNMTLAKPGEIVFSYARQMIRSIGIVQKEATTARKPSELSGSAVTDNWNIEGWLLPTSFQPVSVPIHPKEHWAQIKPLLPGQYSPLSLKTGEGNQGEYQALYRLSENAKKKITPLIEIPPIGYDYESGTDRESIDSHLGDFGRRIKAKWQNRTCFLDLKYIPPHTRMGTGKHYVEEVFDQCRSEKCNAIPVVSLKSDPDFLNSVKEVIKKDGKGVCFRIYFEDFERPSLTNALEHLIITLEIGFSEADIIIDYEDRKLEPFGVFVRIFLDLFQSIPVLNRWRTFTVIGTSYPKSIAEIRPPFGTIPRSEWSFYKYLRLGIGAGRLPTFGDYAVAHPALVDLDHRLIKPFAKLRYTIDNEWHIGRGDTVRTHGFDQYRRLCSDLMRQPYFAGPSFSAGDKYIDGCSRGTENTGNLTTWVWVSTNRHLTKVVSDLATLP